MPPDAHDGAIVVLGAGLVGCYVGGRLTASGAVTLIGRDALVAELSAHALRLSDQTNPELIVVPTNLTVTASASALAQAKLIIVTVKSGATASAALSILKYAPPSIPIVSLQNGVSNVEQLRSALPGRTVLAGMVPFNVMRRALGHFHKSTTGDLVIEASPTLQPWLDCFAQAGLPIIAAADMTSVAWGKLIINLNNAVNALSGLPLAEQLADRKFRRIWSMAQCEALCIAKAAGIASAPYNGRPLWLVVLMLRLPDWMYQLLSRSVGRVDKHARSSMAEDIISGRPTEVDYINGAVVALAQRLGQIAPVNARLVGLIHLAEKDGRRWHAPALYQDIVDIQRAARPRKA